ncbi:Unknown protein, partial [Striga hermonthica]
LGSSFWGMTLILASTNLLTARIAAGCLILSLLIILFIAKNLFYWRKKLLLQIHYNNHFMFCVLSGFIVFIGVIWLLQELTAVCILRYIILFI